MKNLFTKHPHEIGETYLQHLKFAFIFGKNMLLGGLAFIIHAIFPFLFQKTGSHFLFKTTHHFVDRMPATEERCLALSKTLEEKMRNQAIE